MEGNYKKKNKKNRGEVQFGVGFGIFWVYRVCPQLLIIINITLILKYLIKNSYIHRYFRDEEK